VSTNKEIFDELSRRVIGHDKAKKVLINLVNRSKLRYKQKWGELRELEDLASLSNCLLIGDSGTGKTFLVESLSEVMDFPLMKIDATELNPTGASGGLKKKDLIKKIVKYAEHLVAERPETYFSVDGTLDQVVVFVDEVDKLGQRISGDWNAHVQANFLTLFENKGDFSGITFVFAGAFQGMSKEKEVKKRSIGFNSSDTEDKKEKDIDFSQKIIQYGLLPELVGRMNNIVALDVLKLEEYKNILHQQILPRTRKQLADLGVLEFDLSDDQIETLVNEASESGLGVRGLQTGVNKLLVDIEFSAEKYED
jgi:ATP-dependent Clp protease ATP-binding subunit ClpX